MFFKLNEMMFLWMMGKQLVVDCPLCGAELVRASGPAACRSCGWSAAGQAKDKERAW